MRPGPASEEARGFRRFLLRGLIKVTGEWFLPGTWWRQGHIYRASYVSGLTHNLLNLAGARGASLA